MCLANKTKIKKTSVKKRDERAALLLQAALLPLLVVSIHCNDDKQESAAGRPDDEPMSAVETG